jgi:hypothetical protein
MIKRGSLTTLALEVFSIVLGVLLALAVSEWQQEREYAELAAAALVNVSREMEANRDVLMKIHENNAATVAAMEAAVEQDDSDLTERQFIPGIQVRSTAWDTLLSSGVANHVDYDLLLTLSETYSYQAIYRQTGLQLVDASMSMAAMATVNETEIDNTRFQQQFSTYFNMMLVMEELLLDGYETALAEVAP